MSNRNLVLPVLIGSLLVLALAGCAGAPAAAPVAEAPATAAPVAAAPTEAPVITVAPAATAEPVAQEEPTEEPKEMTAEDCLACHGPFDALQAKTAEYQTEDGEQANPHMFVPHDSEKIVNCSFCHEPHAIPPEADYEAEADTEYCLDACHHVGTLQPCSDCHDH